MVTDNLTVKKLTAGLLFLVALYVFSFFMKKNEQKSMTVNTALVNPKYVSDITEIRIRLPVQQKMGTELSDIDNPVSDSVTEIILKKYGNMWTGEQNTIQKKDDSNEKVIWPADKETVEKLIEYASKVRKLYEKSDSVKNFEKLSVTGETAKVLAFYKEDGQLVSELMFGNENALTSRINVRSSAKLQVYEIDDDISIYLNTKSSFYADPYLYPLCLTEFSVGEKAALLRHGNIYNSLEEKDKCMQSDLLNVLRKDFADGSGVILKIYKIEGQKDNTYTVVPEYIPSLTAGKNERTAFNKLNYCYSISSWTYEKLLNEIDY